MLYPNLQRRIAWFADFLYRRRAADSKSTGLAVMAVGDCGQCRVGAKLKFFDAPIWMGRNCSEALLWTTAGGNQETLACAIVKFLA